MREIDGASIRHDEASGDQDVEHAVDVVAERFVQLLGWNRTTRRRRSLARLDQPQQEGTGDILAVSVELGREHAVGGLGDRPPHPAGLAVVGDLELRAATATPRLQQRV